MNRLGIFTRPAKALKSLFLVALPLLLSACDQPEKGYSTYKNQNGELGVLITGGAVDIGKEPFFATKGKNGRTCSTCHQPQDAMALSVAGIKKKWQESGAQDPLFDTWDGANCPNLPRDAESSHSLLLERGLIRIQLPWPPRDLNGNIIEPEFRIEVVSDPTGCNTSKEYGLNNDRGFISVFRRPRPAANLVHLTSFYFEDFLFWNLKEAKILDRDPDSGKTVPMALMSDARVPTLKEQAKDAISSHFLGIEGSEEDFVQSVVDFENRVYMAQAVHNVGGSLTEEDGPKGLGPFNMSIATPGIPGDHSNTPVFQFFDQWDPAKPADQLTEEEAFRASVARGADIFMNRLFWIDDVAGLTNIGLGNPLKRTCSTCHNAQMTGHDLAPGLMDLGLNNWPESHDPELPLFKITCEESARPHPFIGRVIYTSDPGRALITGKCETIGGHTMQQLRGLSARAPYFANGSARTLGEVISFYERRFKMGLTDQERQDLINLLSVL